MKSAAELFKEHDDEYLEFDKVSIKYSSRPDLHAFILLDKLFPDKSDIIGAASHDEIILNIREEWIELLTEDQIIELTRCGIRYIQEYNCLGSYV